MPQQEPDWGWFIRDWARAGRLAPLRRAHMSKAIASRARLPIRLRPPQSPISRAFSSYSHCRSEEHTSELQSLMHISYAVFCLKKKTTKTQLRYNQHTIKYTTHYTTTHRATR